VENEEERRRPLTMSGHNLPLVLPRTALARRISLESKIGFMAQRARDGEEVLVLQTSLGMTKLGRGTREGLSQGRAPRSTAAQ
jgi:hypothetical protein